MDAKLIELALRYEQTIKAIVDVLNVYERMKSQAPSMSPESAIELIHEALGRPKEVG